MPCLYDDYVCDGVTHCQDSSDELGCPCGYNAQWCFRTNICVYDLLNKRCDGNNDCGDWEDEEDCPCLDSQLECASYEIPPQKCLDVYRFCDGIVDCLDASDETICNVTCSEDELR